MNLTLQMMMMTIFIIITIIINSCNILLTVHISVNHTSDILGNTHKILVKLLLQCMRRSIKRGASLREQGF